MIAILYFHQAAAKGASRFTASLGQRAEGWRLCEDSRSVELTSRHKESPVNSVIVFAFIHRSQSAETQPLRLNMRKTNTSVWTDGHTLDGMSSQIMFDAIKSFFFVSSSAEALSVEFSFVLKSEK